MASDPPATLQGRFLQFLGLQRSTTGELSMLVYYALWGSGERSLKADGGRAGSRPG
jgi:hypothetical protein